eukprot:CAMPEP_0197025546 /NCGR_PEP_ID=MMETSP1384-20130603/5840_1 /TAXON_ID=29189 /ORGANISM="Ammonia sp." /LENGTH=499 /DNA_ID=CAMNT_0042454085 /DNA_START=29 /DNA_END=1528 /DNA_ORIENTATION=-
MATTETSPLLDDNDQTASPLKGEPSKYPLPSAPSESALSAPSQRRSSISDSWKWYHTAIVLCIRLIIDFVFKNPLVFYLNYQQGLLIDYMQFGYILVAAEIGCIFAIFIGDFNKRVLRTEERIMETYLVIAGLANIAFPALSYFGITLDGELYVIVWCCVMRFIVGLSFANISAASIKFAAQYVPNASKITSIIAVLHYSWPLSTAINILAGYLILDASWMSVFFYSGVLLIVTGLFASFFFKCCPLAPPDLAAPDRGGRQRVPSAVINASEPEEVEMEMDDEEDDNRSGLRVLFTDGNSLLIIFVSFFMTFRSRSIYIVTSSLWMEGTFSLDASMVGWTTLSVIIGEVLGLMVMSTVSHKFELWKSAAGTLVHQLVFGALLFVLAAIYGNDISLAAALILTGLLTMGHESFYVVQQSNAIHYAPLPRLKFLLLLGERMAQESASIVALFLTVSLWYLWAENAVLLWSIVWIAGTFMESFILFIYRSEPTIKQSFVDEV